MDKTSGLTRRSYCTIPIAMTLIRGIEVTVPSQVSPLQINWKQAMKQARGLLCLLATAFARPSDNSWKVKRELGMKENHVLCFNMLHSASLRTPQ